jgi:hypothetical protein
VPVDPSGGKGHVFEPQAYDPAAPAAERLIRLSCLDYGAWRPPFAGQAREFLAGNPALAGTDIFTASAVGDVAAAERILSRDGALARTKGGPFGWEPLLYACYSRLDGDAPEYSTLEVARLLLAREADPNAGFLWSGNLPPFTALTGAFGEGEDGSNQPPHRDQDALARLLLEAGADPNDGQTLYNRHFRPNDDHLKLLFAYGLGQDRGGPWFYRFPDRLMSPAAMLAEELWCAARKNFVERVELLVEHGADVNMPGFRDGRTPYEAALLAGNEEVAEYLLRNGARRIELDPDAAFAAACVTGRRDEVRARLKADPELIERLGPGGRSRLVHRAVEANRIEGVRLLAELGFEMTGRTRHDGVGMNLDVTPLHNAAWMGNFQMVRLLLDLGADPTVREPTYDATPADWAEHNHQAEVAAYLANLSGKSH